MPCEAPEGTNARKWLTETFATHADHSFSAFIEDTDSEITNHALTLLNTPGYFTDSLALTLSSLYHLDRITNHQLNFDKERSAGANQNYCNLLDVTRSIRIDIKNFADVGSTLILEAGSDIRELPATWYCDEKGVGRVLNSSKLKTNFKITPVMDGELKIHIRSLDIRDKDLKRILIPQDLLHFAINGKLMLDKPRTVDHDHTYSVSLKVKKEETLYVEIQWVPHPLLESKLTELIQALYARPRSCRLGNSINDKL